MRLVVTGSQGFIGRAVVSACLSQGFQLLAVGRRAGPGTLRPEVPYHRYVEDDPGSLLPPELAGQDWMLIHLAWDTSRAASFGAHARHVWRMAEMLDYWSSRGLRYVIGTGSAEEFGGRSGMIAPDDGPVGNLSPYGWGKHCAARLLGDWTARTGVGSLWLRPFVVYGPGQTGEMLVPYAVRRALARQPAQFSDGQQRRDFVYIDDVARAFALAAEKRPAGHQSLNVGTGTSVAVREVLLHLGKALDAESLFQLGAIPRRPQEPMEQAAQIKRAAELLDWQPTTDWQTGLDRLVQSVRG